MTLRKQPVKVEVNPCPNCNNKHIFEIIIVYDDNQKAKNREGDYSKSLVFECPDTKGHWEGNVQIPQTPGKPRIVDIEGGSGPINAPITAFSGYTNSRNGYLKVIPYE